MRVSVPTEQWFSAVEGTQVSRLRLHTDRRIVISFIAILGDIFEFKAKAWMFSFVNSPVFDKTKQTNATIENWI